MNPNAASQYRKRVAAAGGILAQQAGRVARQFATKLSNDSAPQITELLREQGLGVDPALEAVTERDFVQLYLLESAPERQPETTPTARRAAVDQATEAATTAGGATAAMVGAAAVAGLFALLGLGSFWLYGLLYALAGAAGLWVLRFRLQWLARLLLPRFRWLRFGWMFGALPMFVVVSLVGLFIVSPISAERDAQARERDAKAEIARANQAIKRGELGQARDHIRRAKDRDRSVAGIGATEERLSEAVERAEDEARSRRRYDGAVQAFREDDYLTAIGNLEELGNYRDSRTLAARYRVIGSKRLLATARRVYKPRDPREAIEAARMANELDSTKATKTFLVRARRQLASVRRDRQRARRLAAQRRRAERQRQRELAAERRRQEELEEEQAAAPPPDDTGGEGGGGMGAPCDNGWTINWCGASRDGDSDGCWCEE